MKNGYHPAVLWVPLGYHPPQDERTTMVSTTQDPTKTPPTKPGPEPRKAKPKPAPLVVTKAPLPTRPPEAARPAPEPAKLHALVDTDEKLRALIYADPGVGKTTAALRAADFGQVVVIDADRGLKRRALARAGINVDNIEVFQDIRYEALEQLYFDLLKRQKDGNGIFALVWDGITLTIPWLVEAAVAEGVAKAQQLGRQRAEFDVYVEDYGTMTEQLRRLIVRRFFDLDCHIIITAHSSRDKDENGGVRIGPDITPALAKSIKGAVDLILLMEARETPEGQIRRVITRPFGVKEAKDRLGIFPRGELLEPGFDRILAYANEEMTADNDPLLQRGDDDEDTADDA